MATIKLTPQLKELIKEASRVCFGNLPVVNFRTGFKVLKQKPFAPIAQKYYMENYTKDMRKISSNFRTELQERRDEQLVRLVFVFLSN